MHADDGWLHRGLVRAEPAGMTSRRAALAGIGAALATPALAQAPWPNRPIRMVVPFAPGGSSDVLARLIQPGLGAALGQSIVIENRAGAGSMLGNEMVARAAPDGYTFLLADLPFAIIPGVQERMPYDTIADFTPISLVGVAPLLMFGKMALPVTNAADFAALARQRPDTMTFGSGGVGAASHMMGELFQRATGTRLTHVPYRGGGPAILALAAGDVDAVFVTIASAAPQLSGAQVRGLGVMADQRMPSQPSIPTMREQGIDIVANHWWGVLGPARMPEAIVARMAAALADVMHLPDLAPRLDALAVIPRADGPAPFAALIRQDFMLYGGIARAQGIRAQ